MLKLTEEQAQVVRASLTQDGTILVNAFAGTGKTTTCIACITSALKAKWNVLYLVYNKAMEKEAQQRLSSVSAYGRGAVVKTAHAFAFAYMKDKIKGQLGNLRASEVAYVLDCDMGFALRVLKLYFGFLLSGEDFTADGLKAYLSKELKSPYYKGYSPDELYSAVFEVISLVEEGKLPMPHDHYLKLFVETVAKSLRGRFNLVILDESQDANPVFIKLLKTLGARTTLLVGDRHQKIYGFRNTVDASRYFPDASFYYLTESFRFGESIAELANHVLSFKGEEKKVKGKGTKGHNGFTAYLSRTNSGVLRKILELGMPVKTQRPIEDVLRPALSVLYLLYPSDFASLGFDAVYPYVDNAIVKAFRNVKDFREYVENPECDDQELLSAYNLVEYLKRKDKLFKLREVFNFIDPNSNVVCATAHSTKGVEYGTVYVGEDLRVEPEEALGYLLAKNRIEPPDKDYCEQKELDHELLTSSVKHAQEVEEELNLIYVALTRAIKECHYDSATLENLRKAKKLFDDYVLSQELPPKKPTKKPTRGR